MYKILPYTIKRDLISVQTEPIYYYVGYTKITTKYPYSYIFCDIHSI